MRLRHTLLALAATAGLMLGTPALAQDLSPSPDDILYGALYGGNEVPPANLNAFGAFHIVFVSPAAICVSFTVHHLTGAPLPDPGGAHIHRGRAGENGPVVIPLRAPRRANRAMSADCYGNLDPRLLRQIRGNASNFYLNVHTDRFPGGEIRGQLK